MTGERPAEFPNRSQTTGRPAGSGHHPAYGNPGGVAPNLYGRPANAFPQQGGALQPYVQPAPAIRYPPPVPMVHPQFTGPALVSSGGRLGALLLDGLLALVTLWIGWFIWSMFTWSDGQTPAKKLLGHVVADPSSGAAFDWGRMALREFCVKGLLGSVLNLVTFGIFFWVDALMCFGDRQRTLHDRMANSVVRYR
jgi:hypothetical protein